MFAYRYNLYKITDSDGVTAVQISLLSVDYVHMLDTSKAEESRLLDAYLCDALCDPAVGQ
ncbi:MAG: hypothetical protein NVS3B16_23340 [Vulcanimicrobiaceae bacterium]